MKSNVLCGDVQDVLQALAGDNSFDACLCDPPYGLGFMGKQWDHGIPSADVWREVYRVLKPGAMLLAFGGTRTHHRLMCAIEDAGFEVRDCLMWLYGSGFPKSLDIGKALDKAAGAERTPTGVRVYADGTPGHWGVSDKYAQDSHTRSLVTGTAKLATAPATDAKTWDGYGTALKPAWEPIVLAMKPCDGTFAENALRHKVAGLAIDAGRIGTEARRSSGMASLGTMHDDNWVPKDIGVKEVLGRWPANLLLDEEAAAMLDEQSDGSSRFFYTAKASRSERGEGNNHPTVKPIKLCGYLAKLILPPVRGTPRRLLTPFCGSGSEMLGAQLAGWDYALGIDNHEEYVKIAKRRLEATE